MKALLILVIVGVAHAALSPVPLGTVQATQEVAVSTITDIMAAENQVITNAEAVFKPVNDSCAATYSTAVDSCRQCKNDKCQARKRRVCTPREQQSVGGSVSGIEAIPFIASGIPQLITNTISRPVKGAVNTAVNTVGNVVTNQIPNAVGNAVGGAVHGVTNAGKTVGQFAANLAGEVADTAGDVINTVGGAFESGANDVKDAFEDAGRAVVGWFGKRALRYNKRSAEPTCADLQSNYTAACQFYASANYCPSCTFNIDTECPGYTAAEAEYLSVLGTVSYRSRIPDDQWNMVIKKISYDGATFDPPTGGFRVVAVEATLFGVDMSFRVSQPVNVWTPDTSGPVIAGDALAKFKSM